MRKRITSMLLCILSLSMIVVSCKKDDDTDNPSKNDAKDGSEFVYDMKKMNCSGIVRNSYGHPIEGVAVVSGDETTTTDECGMFAIDQVAAVSGRFIVRFSLDGYFTITKSEAISANKTLDVVLQEKGESDCSSHTTFETSKGSDLKVGKMNVSIQGGSLVKADGTPYSGKVEADVLYLSPDASTFATMMPGGDMEAVRYDKSESILLSYGMVEVSLTDAKGDALQLKDGVKSTLTFPVPEKFKSNPPAIMPLWSFDENTGLWVEEGVATLEEGVYVGEVSHFSWHNLDYPESRATVKGTVTYQLDGKEMPMSNQRVDVGETYTFTNSNGEYIAYVPAGVSFNVFVYAECPKEETIPALTAGQVYTQDFTLDCGMKVVKGKVTNSCGAMPNVFIARTDYYMTPSKPNEDGDYFFYLNNNVENIILSFWTTDGQKVQRKVECTESVTEVETVDFCADEPELLLTEEEVVGVTTSGKRIVLKFVGSENKYGESALYFVMTGFEEDGAIDMVKGISRLYYFFDDEATYDAALEKADSYVNNVKENNRKSKYFATIAAFPNDWETFDQVVDDAENGTIPVTMMPTEEYVLVK